MDFPHFRNSNIFSCTADLSWIDSYLQEVFITYQTFKQQIRQSLQVTEYDDLADFGLDDPANTVTLKTDSGLTTIYIGSQNEITNEYYLKTGDSDTIYVVDSAPATGFDKSIEDLTAKADDTETEAEEPSEAVDETETATVVPNETEAVETEETK